jgi:hypothetical protein
MEELEEIKSSTNSPLGSTHWFRTIVGNMLRTGEFLAEYGTSKPDLVKPYGQSIYNTCKELLAGHGKINNLPAELNDHDKELLYNIELLIAKNKENQLLDLTEKLQKANEDKAKMGELLKELLQISIEANQLAQDNLQVFGGDLLEKEEEKTAEMCSKIHLVLTQCDIIT